VNGELAEAVRALPGKGFYLLLWTTAGRMRVGGPQHPFPSIHYESIMSLMLWPTYMKRSGF